MPTKKYSINWENDEPISFEVDGVVYESVDQILDEEDREKLTAMMDASFDESFEQHFEKEWEEFDREFKKDIEANQKSAASMEKWVLGIFTGVAVLMLLIAALTSASAILKINSEESAPGHVVEIIQRREYVNEEDRIIQDYYFPVVEYVSRDGRPHSVQMSEGSSRPDHEVGDAVTVLYNPERPLDARIKSFGSSALMWIWPGITGLLGLAFLGAVLIVRKVMAPEQAEQGHSGSP